MGPHDRPDDIAAEFLSDPEPPARPDEEKEPERGKRRQGLGRLPTRDVPEPPNRDDIRPDDDVTPDAGTVEPPD